MSQLTDVFTALSHPTRRAIIGQRAHGSARFLDVAEPFATTPNAVTTHLKLLDRAGLIERRNQGRDVFISLRGEPLRAVAGWAHEYERFWNTRRDQFEWHFNGKNGKADKLLLNPNVDGFFYWAMTAHYRRITEVERLGRLQHTRVSSALLATTVFSRN